MTTVTSNAFEVQVSVGLQWLKGHGALNLSSGGYSPNKWLWIESSNYLNQQMPVHRCWSVADTVRTFTELSNGGSGANWQQALDTNLLPTRVLINHAFPPIPKDFTTANGGNQGIFDTIGNTTTYDWAYTGAAQTFRSELQAAGRDPNGGDLIMSFGHEMNGSWYPWSVFDNVSDWHAAWDKWTSLFLAVMPDVRFEVQVVNRKGGVPYGQNQNSGTMTLQQYVPPTNVDFLTRSVHDNINPGLVYTLSDFNRYHIEPDNFGYNKWGLQDVVDWVDANNKQWGISEWAPQIEAEAGNPNLPQSPAPDVFIEGVYNFLAANQTRLAYDTYYSQNHTLLYSVARQATAASQKYKLLWTQ